MKQEIFTDEFLKEGSFDIQKWRNLEGNLDILDGFIVEIEGDYYIFYIVFPSH